jgi:hypothetical protein
VYILQHVFEVPVVCMIVVHCLGDRNCFELCQKWTTKNYIMHVDCVYPESRTMLTSLMKKVEGKDFEIKFGNIFHSG